MTSNHLKEVRMRSTSDRPDLDWSQIRETILMLNLATARIEYCMRDGDDSVETLTNSFTSMAGNVAAIRSALEQLWQDAEIDGDIKEAVYSNADKITEKMKSAIVAFQFYDKLVQRLNHIGKSMSALGDLVGDQHRLYSPYEWNALQEKIRAQYSMTDEIEMFDKIVKGMSVEEVVQAMRDKHETPSTKDDQDVELF